MEHSPFLNYQLRRRAEKQEAAAACRKMPLYRFMEEFECFLPGMRV